MISAHGMDLSHGHAGSSNAAPSQNDSVEIAGEALVVLESAHRGCNPMVTTPAIYRYTCSRASERMSS